MRPREVIARAFCIFGFCIFAVHVCTGVGGSALAERRSVPIDAEFPIPTGFEGRIAFWRYVFTKYGDNHRLFHHRDEPAIIYSVLDFSEINESLDGRANLRAREKAVEVELERIRKALINLAKGAAPSNDLEKRIVDLFKKHLRANKQEFRKAADLKLIRYQRGIKERFREGLVRSGRYLYAIEGIFQSEGLPPGLARLPHVESSFDYNAYSSVGAAGIWQFMRSTGKLYMRIDASIDERRDPILATRAAARYLSSAYKRLGSWPLAITSYNHGVAGVARAVKQTGSNDLSVIVDRYESKTFGFASGNFYAEFLAALEVDRNAEFYFPGLKRESPWYFDEVRLGKSLRFSEIARRAKTSKSEIEKYNKAFRSAVLQDRVWVPRGSVIKLPRGSRQHFVAAVPAETIALSAPAKDSKSDLTAGYRVSGSGYQVQSGDTVGGIARRFKVSAAELMAANNISDPRRLRAGQKLNIPGRQAAPPSRSAEQVKVRSGDTLSEIAAENDVSVAALKRENNLRDADALRIGQTLEIPASNGSGVAKKTYIVQKGDTLSGIAKRHGLSLARLKELNPGASGLIKPGQTLALD